MGRKRVVPKKQPDLPGVDTERDAAPVLSLVCSKCLNPMVKLRVSENDDDTWEFHFRCIRCDKPGQYAAAFVNIVYPLQG